MQVSAYAPQLTQTYGRIPSTQPGAAWAVAQGTVAQRFPESPHAGVPTNVSLLQLFRVRHQRDECLHNRRSVRMLQARDIGGRQLLRETYADIHKRSRPDTGFLLWLSHRCSQSRTRFKACSMAALSWLYGGG